MNTVVWVSTVAMLGINGDEPIALLVSVCVWVPALDTVTCALSPHCAFNEFDVVFRMDVQTGDFAKGNVFIALFILSAPAGERIAMMLEFAISNELIVECAIFRFPVASSSCSRSRSISVFKASTSLTADTCGCLFGADVFVASLFDLGAGRCA